jgi:hypothetical protein
VDYDRQGRGGGHPRNGLGVTGWGSGLDVFECYAGISASV